MAPREIREALGVSKPGALDLLNPLMQAGPDRHTGTADAARTRQHSTQPTRAVPSRAANAAWRTDD
jgi:hypothetical protein